MSPDSTGPELAGLASTAVPLDAVVLVPVGSIEQHGPHLPLDTDTAIATAVASAVAERMEAHVLVAPPLSYGSSGEHQSFPGTSSIGNDVLRATIIELVRSMSTWAARIVFVNAHGGNIAALAAAIVQMGAEQHDVAWVPCVSDEVDLHAGLMETSLMLHLRPESVDMRRAQAGDMRSLTEILPQLKSGGVAAVSPNGVLGDPRKASAVEGQRTLKKMIDDVAKRIRSAVLDTRGMLVAASADVPR